MAKAPKIKPLLPITVTINDQATVLQMPLGYAKDNPYFPALLIAARSGSSMVMPTDAFKSLPQATQTAFLRGFIGDLQEMVDAAVEVG